MNSKYIKKNSSGLLANLGTIKFISYFFLHEENFMSCLALNRVNKKREREQTRYEVTTMYGVCILFLSRARGGPPLLNNAYESLKHFSYLINIHVRVYTVHVMHVIIGKKSCE